MSLSEGKAGDTWRGDGSPPLGILLLAFTGRLAFAAAAVATAVSARSMVVPRSDGAATAGKIAQSISHRFRAASVSASATS